MPPKLRYIRRGQKLSLLSNFSLSATVFAHGKLIEGTCSSRNGQRFVHPSPAVMLKNEQLFAAMFEILHYLAIVPLASRDVNLFVTLRVPDSVNLLSHRRFFLAEMINNTSDLLIRWPQAQYKLATWKFPIQFLVKNRPSIVLKGIELVCELECHFVHLSAGLGLSTQFGPVTR